MQADLRVALTSRARLAALGEAVAKINHDLRNMLTSAQIASERMAASGDPKVAQALPRLERALDRAITLASNVLAFGKSEEPPPQKRPTPLRQALEAAAEDAGLTRGGVAAGRRRSIPTIEAEADPDQLHRILVNLLKQRPRSHRRSRKADERGRNRSPPRPGWRTGAWSCGSRTTDRACPSGPARTCSSRSPGSVRRGGAGLGLAIAHELAQAHGGELALVETGEAGTVFEIRLPGA